jgi:DNA-binding response OmpR family regulator
LERGSDNKRTRILIVDDDSDILLTFTKALEVYSQFEADTFNDPIEALSRFKVKTYDLLIIDIRLPQMDGFELYDKMKEMDNEVKMCFMTGYDINIKALRAVFALSSDLEACSIRKPIDLQEFIARIKSELRVMKAVRSATIVKEIRSTFLIVL